MKIRRSTPTFAGGCYEEGNGTHSSPLAWKIPWMEEPGRLQSMGLRRVGHDWATSLSLFIFMHWRRKWQPTPMFLPGESQGRQSLVGCCLWDRRVGHDWCDLAAAAATIDTQPHPSRRELKKSQWLLIPISQSPSQEVPLNITYIPLPLVHFLLTSALRDHITLLPPFITLPFTLHF